MKHAELHKVLLDTPEYREGYETAKADCRMDSLPYPLLKAAGMAFLKIGTPYFAGVAAAIHDRVQARADLNARWSMDDLAALAHLVTIRREELARKPI